MSGVLFSFTPGGDLYVCMYVSIPGMAVYAEVVYAV